MTPQQRIKGKAVYLALEKISPELPEIPNANTGFSAGIGLEGDIGLLTGIAKANWVARKFKFQQLNIQLDSAEL